MIWYTLTITVRRCLVTMDKSVGEEPRVEIEIPLTLGNTDPLLTMKMVLSMTATGISMRTPGTTPVLAWLQESTMSMLKTTLVV